MKIACEKCDKIIKIKNESKDNGIFALTWGSDCKINLCPTCERKFWDFLSLKEPSRNRLEALACFGCPCKETCKYDWDSSSQCLKMLDEAIQFEDKHSQVSFFQKIYRQLKRKITE